MSPLVKLVFLCAAVAVASASVFNRANFYKSIGKKADDSCFDRCGDKLDPAFPCQCNTQCSQFGDCCSDYDALCGDGGELSCVGKCNQGNDPSQPCQCNKPCLEFGDCCPDYVEVCDDDEDPGGVTDAELAALSEELLSLDVNNANSLITVNLQDRTSSGGPDNAPEPLLTVDPAAFQIPTIALLLKVQDNYIPAVSSAEVVTDAERADEAAFLDAVFGTTVMERTVQFITDKKLITGDVREALYKIWFGLYSRSGSTLGSSGFEHSFVGELNSGVSGFHSWVYFATEEAKGNADYNGYIETLDFEKGSIVTNSFDWLGQNKPTGGFFVGTSPEFELALYSVCWYARPNARCNYKLGGKSLFIQTYDITSGGSKYVASAYPAVA